MPTVGLTPGGGRSYPSPPRLSRCPLPGGGCHVPTVPVLSRGRQGRWARDDGTFVLCPGHRHHVTHARVARQRRRAIPATGAGGGSRPLARSVRVGLAGDLPQVPAVLAVKEPRLLAAQPPTSSGRAEPPPDDVLTARVPGSREQLRRAEPDGPLRQPRSAGLIHANWPWCLRPPAWSHGVSEAPTEQPIFTVAGLPELDPSRPYGKADTDRKAAGNAAHRAKYRFLSPCAGSPTRSG